MTHKYIHKFKNGKVITLTADFSGGSILLNCEPKFTSDIDMEEYMQWKNSVSDEILSQLNNEQVYNAAMYGVKHLGKKNS